MNTSSVSGLRISGIQGGHDMRQDRGVLAAGRCHCDALSRRKQLVFRDGRMNLLLEGAVEALSAQLRMQGRVRQGEAERDGLEAASSRQDAFCIFNL